MHYLSLVIVVGLWIVVVIFSVAPFLQLTLNSYVRSFPLGICITTGLPSYVNGKSDAYTAFIYNTTVEDAHGEFLTNFTVKFPARMRPRVVSTKKTVRNWLIEFQKKDTKCHYNVDDREAYPIPISVFKSGSSGLLWASIIFASFGLVLTILIIISICQSNRKISQTTATDFDEFIVVIYDESEESDYDDVAEVD